MMSEPFARILSAGRAHFNERVVEARRRHPALDTAAFSQFLLSCVDPLVVESARLDAGRAAAVALASYDLALELTGQALVGPGARSKWIGPMWCELAPRLIHLVMLQPAEVLGLLSNAVLYIESVDGARPEQWLVEMSDAAPGLASVEDLKAAGQVIAWRSGIAHFRRGALDAALRLPAALAQGIFGSVRPWDAIHAELVADPWWRPGRGGSIAAEVGQFAGFGGAFMEPPSVRPHPDGFAVRSGDRYHLLIADAWGTVLHAAAAEEFDDSARDAGGGFTLHGATLGIGNREIALDLPADGLAACRSGKTVAVTSPYTHAILLYPAS